MIKALDITLLTLDEVDRAFPLVRETHPEVKLENWRSFAKRRIADQPVGPGGILAVRNAQNYIVGLGCYRRSDDLIHGIVLHADLFCALDIIGQNRVARILEAGMANIARRHGCTALHTSLPSQAGSDGWVTALLHERGYHLDAIQMCKLLPDS